MVDLGIVIPVYGSGQKAGQLLLSIREALSGVCSYHVFFIDDGNPKGVCVHLRKICTGKEATLIVLKHNSGQQKAVLCGMKYASHCKYIAMMDDDLEHPAAVLQQMYQMILRGYDLVYGIPAASVKSRIRSLGTCMRDLFFQKILKCPSNIKVSSFRIMNNDTASRICRKAGGFFYFSAEALSLSIRIGNIVYTPPALKNQSSGYCLSTLVLLYAKLLLYYGPVKKIVRKFEKKTVPYQIREVFPRIMILGGGNCQLHSYQYARERGIQTIMVDYSKNPAAKNIADIHERISSFDGDACIQAGREHHIQAVVAVGTDQPVYTAARVSNILKIPGCLLESEALGVTNKKKMKEIMREHSIPTAPYFYLKRDGELPDITFSSGIYVMKPLDSQGQRGVYKINSREALKEHLEKTLSFSRCSEALVEEFYESDEVTVSGWMEEGNLTILTITDRLHYPDTTHIGVSIGHRFPSVYMKQYEQIERICKRLVHAFKLKRGPFYLQLLIGNKGIWVNELACRIGGAFEDIMIPYVTGFDILDAVMKQALGIEEKYKWIEDFRCDNSDKAVSIQLIFCRPGRIHWMTPLEEIQKLPYILDAGYQLKTGDAIKEVENATARMGYAVIAGSNSNIREHIHDFYKHFNVLDKNGDNLVIKDYLIEKSTGVCDERYNKKL